jgi:hypothetical protein
MLLRAFLGACPAAGQGSNPYKNQEIASAKAPRNDCNFNPKQV